MIINRQVWSMTGQLFPILAGRIELDQLESDDTPAPCTGCTCAHDTEDDE